MEGSQAGLCSSSSSREGAKRVKAGGKNHWMQRWCAGAKNGAQRGLEKSKGSLTQPEQVHVCGCSLKFAFPSLFSVCMFQYERARVSVST